MKAKSEKAPRPPALPAPARGADIRGTQPAYSELLHFFNESMDMLCIADFEGMFKRLNPAWEPTLGWTLPELRSRPFLDFVHPDDRTATLAEMGTLAKGATTIIFENRYHCKDGTYKWLQWTATPLPEIQEIYAIARDVTRQKHLEQQILLTLDHERERMGRELHDGLCQDMASIAVLATSLSGRLEPTLASESKAASDIASLLSKAIQEMRYLARGYDPLHLELMGFEDALTAFCAKTQSLFNISCAFHARGKIPRLSAPHQAHIYRIIQEAVSNAINHGTATRVDLSLEVKNKYLSLSITDDGVGIGMTPGLQDGLGLHTMAYRARAIGGTIEIKKGSPGGTIVSLVVPLRTAK